MRHYGLGAPAEERKQVVDQLPLRGIAGYRGFENMEVTDLPDAADGFLSFEAINGGLDGRVSWSVLFGKSFLDLADRGLALNPQGLHDLKFELRSFRLCHFLSTTSVCHSTTAIGIVKFFWSSPWCDPGRPNPA